jgi:hypothetical protein
LGPVLTEFKSSPDARFLAASKRQSSELSFRFLLSAPALRLLPSAPMPTLNWIGKEAVVNHHHQVPLP